MIHWKSSFNTLYIFSILVLVSWVLIFLIEKTIVSEQLIIEYFDSQLSLKRIEQLIQSRNSGNWIRYALLPIIYLIKFFFVSLWFLCGTILYGYRTSLSQIFQILIISEFIWIVPLVLLLVWFGFIDTNYSLNDVQYFQPLSLLNLFDGPSVETWLIFPLKALNLFEIAYMIVLALGLRKVLKRDFNSSLSFTVPVYGSGLIIWIILITFLSINLST